MNRLIVAAVIAACIVAPVVAQDSKPDEPSSVGTVEGDDPEALKLITDCDARKFETVVEREVDGQKQSSRVKLCGKQGQTDAEWVATLKDAASKITANEKMPQSAKDQLTAALKAEIGRIEGATNGSVATQPAVALPETVAPTPPIAAPIIASKPSAPATALSKRPRLTVKCLAPGEKGGGTTCTALNRATILAIHADSDLTSGTSLRFLRRGDARGTLALAPMRQGEMFRSKLPPELCAGVASSRVEIQVMGSNQLVESYGPYSLRC